MKGFAGSEMEALAWAQIEAVQRTNGPGDQKQ